MEQARRAIPLRLRRRIDDLGAANPEATLGSPTLRAHTVQRLPWQLTAKTGSVVVTAITGLPVTADLSPPTEGLAGARQRSLMRLFIDPVRSDLGLNRCSRISDRSSSISLLLSRSSVGVS
jgi:hypothetical protein